MRIGIGRGSEVEGDLPITEMILCAKPHTASRMNAKAERFCCRHVWMVEQVMTCALQPGSVRLPPNILRLLIGSRSANSAK